MKVYKCRVCLGLFTFIVSGLCLNTVFAQAITPLSIQDSRAHSKSRKWPLGEICAVSDARTIVNLGRTELSLWDAKSGAYLKLIDTTALFQFAENYVDTSSELGLESFKQVRLKEDSVSLKHFIWFDGIQDIPGSQDYFVQATFSVKRRLSENYHWGYLRAMIRVDAKLNVQTIHEVQEVWRPETEEGEVSLMDRRFAGALSATDLVFYEPNKELADTLLHRYSLVGNRFIPTGRFSALSSFDRPKFHNKVYLSSQVRKANSGDTYIASGTYLFTQFNNTPQLDTIVLEDLEGHRFFDIELDSKSGGIVLLSGLPNERFGYVASKTLSLYDPATNKLSILGTYEKSSTKAFDVSVHDGVAYILLYDDRKNRPLLQKVGIGAGKVFGM